MITIDQNKTSQQLLNECAVYQDNMQFKNYTVYIHRHRITGYLYIGVTGLHPLARWGGLDMCGYSGQEFGKAVFQQGADSFEHLIFGTNFSREEASQLEKDLISFFRNKSVALYNVDAGGLGRKKDGERPHIETRESFMNRADNKFAVQSKLKSKYAKSELQIFVKEDIDQPKFDEMQALLKRVGVGLQMSGNVVSISIDPMKYGKIMREFAGIGKAVALKGDDNQAYCYSDIMLMRAKGKPHDQIMQELGMNRATYFRHYRDMKNSVWYQSLDQSRIGDAEYLESVKGNDIF